MTTINTLALPLTVLKKIGENGGTEDYMHISKKDHGKRVGIADNGVQKRERERERERLTCVDLTEETT